jgi:hypothetical protein
MGESKPVPENPQRRKTGHRVLPASQELDAAQEAELWRKLGKKKSAVDALTVAKANRVGGILRTFDSTPFTPEELAEITQQALRGAIEEPRVCEVLGANLAQTAHEALCGSVSVPICKKAPAKRAASPFSARSRWELKRRRESAAPSKVSRLSVPLVLFFSSHGGELGRIS